MNILSEIKEPSTFIEGLWGRIPRELKYLFLFALAVGLATHLFVFMQKLPNHDDLNEFTLLVEHNLSMGRWFRNVIWHLGGEFSIPWTRGLLALLFLSASCCFTVAVLQINRPLWMGLCATLMITWPVVSSMFTFMFMAEAFQFALLAACCSAWLARRGGWRRLVCGIFILCLGLATYQASFFYAASLLLIALIFDIISGCTEEEIRAKAASALALLSGAFALYLISILVLKWFFQVNLLSYQGVSSLAGTEFLKNLCFNSLNSAALIYRSFAADLFTEPLGAGFFGRYLRLFAALFCVAALMMAAWNRELWKSPLRLLSALVLLLASPLCFSGIYFIGFINPQKAYIFMHVVMTYGGVFLWVLAVKAAAFLAAAKWQKPAAAGCSRLLLWCCLFSLGALAYGNYLFTNETYLKMYLGYEKAYAFSAELTRRIGEELHDGRKLPLAFIGDISKVIDEGDLKQKKFRMMTAAFNGAELVRCNQYHRFLKNYLGCGSVSRLCSKWEEEELAKLPEVKAMPVFPADGSVKVVRKYIVIKLPAGTDVTQENKAEAEE